MAEEKSAEPTQPNQDPVDSAAEDMDVVAEESAANGSKRSREEEEEVEKVKEGNGDVSKKQKVDKSVEEERLENIEGEGKEEKKEESGPVDLGPKSFGSSMEMFDYFYNLLHFWPPNINVNKYEQMVLSDLLKKGHSEPEKKIGSGIQAFQVRYHPMWKSRCFFLIRGDDTMDDFSFRKCVDQILPLPDEMKMKFDGNGKSHGGKGRGGRGGRGRGRGHGRGGRSRN